jgi:hypothetical protein
MLIPFLDAETEGIIYVNPKQISVVFEGKNPEGIQLTMINLLNGNVATREPLLEVVSKLQAELK